MFNKLINITYIILLMIFLIVFVRNSEMIVEAEIKTATCGIYESCVLYGGELSVLEDGVVCRVINK